MDENHLLFVYVFGNSERVLLFAECVFSGSVKCKCGLTYLPTHRAVPLIKIWATKSGHQRKLFGAPQIHQCTDIIIIGVRASKISQNRFVCVRA